MNRKMAAAREKEEDAREEKEIEAQNRDQGGGQQKGAVANPYP